MISTQVSPENSVPIILTPTLVVNHNKKSVLEHTGSGALTDISLLSLLKRVRGRLGAILHYRGITSLAGTWYEIFTPSMFKFNCGLVSMVIAMVH